MPCRSGSPQDVLRFEEAVDADWAATGTAVTLRSPTTTTRTAAALMTLSTRFLVMSTLQFFGCAEGRILIVRLLITPKPHRCQAMFGRFGKRLPPTSRNEGVGRKQRYGEPDQGRKRPNGSVRIRKMI